MSPSLPISRSSSSSSFCFVHPDKNSPSLNGIPDCTKMAHITVLKESHHSKFQLYICSSSCCWYSSTLQKRLYFRGQIDSQVESVESQIDSRGDLLNWCRVLMWAAAVVCDFYIFIMLLFTLLMMLSRVRWGNNSAVTSSVYLLKRWPFLNNFLHMSIITGMYLVNLFLLLL